MIMEKGEPKIKIIQFVISLGFKAKREILSFIDLFQVFFNKNINKYCFRIF